MSVNSYFSLLEQEVMDKFSEDMLTYLREEVKSVAGKYKGSNKERAATKKGNICGPCSIR